MALGSSWHSRPLLWSWRRVVNPKCHSWRMLRRPCLWRSPSKRIAATVGVGGTGGGWGRESTLVFLGLGKMKVIGCWNCRIGCFFLDWLDWLVYFLFLLNRDAVRFGLMGQEGNRWRFHCWIAIPQADRWWCVRRLWTMGYISIHFSFFI